MTDPAPVNELANRGEAPATRSDIVSTTLDAIDVLESGLATTEQYLRALDLAQKVKEAAREMDRRITSAVTKHLLATKGELIMGPKKWYIGREKSVKCRNVRETVEALMQATGGDYDKFVECLSSNAFKPAATVKVLGADADKCFETTFGDELKLKVSDERFQ